MTWPQYVAARHLLAEEHVGIAYRARQREEQVAVDETKAAMRAAGMQGVVLKPREVIQPVEPLVLEKGKQTRGRVA